MEDEKPSTYRCAKQQETEMHWRWKIEKWIDGAAYVLMCEGHAPSSYDADLAIEDSIKRDKELKPVDAEVWGVS